MARFEFSRFILKHAEDPLSALRLLRAARAPLRATGNEKVSEIRMRFHGRSLRLALREHTSDLTGLAEVFASGSYALPPGFDPEVVIDAGANAGMSAVFFSVMFPRARIHAFEPVRENYEMLRRNLEANHLENVTPHQVGLSDRDEELTMQTSTAGMFGSLSAVHGTATEGGIKGEFKECNACLDHLGISRIGLLKLDIEGSELKVIQSLRPRLPQIEVLVGEIHPELVRPLDFLNVIAGTHFVDFTKPAFGDEFCVLFRASRKPWNGYRGGAGVG